MNLYATILAGGSGTRFWPKSRTNLPKQFLVLQGTRSLLQQTVERIASLIPPQRIVIVTAAHQKVLTMAQLPQIPSDQILAEPQGRNTAAAIALAAWYLLRQDTDAMMVVLPADHAIMDHAAFCADVRQAAAAADYHDTLMTLGAQPTYAATGYGYIKLDARLPTPHAPTAHRVAQFTEKPSAAVAAEMIASQQYLWNCGIFIWRAATIAWAIQHDLPELWDGIQTYGAAWQAGASPEVLAAQYAQLPSISIDHGVLERATHVGVVPATFDWSDVGSWRALADLHTPDSDGNVIVGKHMDQGSSGLIVYSPDKLVATVGLSDLIIVQTDDVLLICPKDQDQEVKNFVTMLQQQKQTEYL